MPPYNGDMVEVTRTETVGEDGMVHLSLPELEPGRRVEVTVREHRVLKPDAEGYYRRAGGLEGKIRIAPDFDDPLPEMEPYS